MYGYRYGYNKARSGGLLPVAIGEVFSDDFERVTLGSNYTEVGSPTINMSGSDLEISGGTGNYTKYVRYSAWNTCFENWQIIVEFEADTKAVAFEGIFVGIKSNSAFFNRSVICQFAHGTDAGSTGRSYILSGSSSGNAYAVDASGSAQTVNAGDEIRMTITRAGRQITCLTENLTGATSRSVNFTYPLVYTGPRFMHNTGTPIIGTIGGTQKVHNWNYTTTEKKNIRTLVVADSLGHGLSASDTDNRWANELLDSSTNEWAVNSGPGDYTATVLTKIPEIILVNPQYCILQLGNDIRFGVAQATREANFTSIVNQLTAAGITPVILLVGADSNFDMTGWNTFLSSNYSTIDCFTPLSDGGTGLNAAFDIGDGTHWNDAGHDVNAATVLADAPYVL